MAQPSIGAQASRLAKDFTLNGASRTRMPKLVYGTAWKKDATANLVYMALKAGFRGIDTAAQPKHYHEQGVALGFKQALTEGIVRREEVFVSNDALDLGPSGPWDVWHLHKSSNMHCILQIQTKFTPPAGQNENAPYDFNAPLEDKVHQSVLSSLHNFTIQGQETYLDSVVIHSPMASMSETMKVWKTLETYHPHKIRNLGISNATLSIVEALYASATIKPSVVQNRFYADTDYEVHLRAFCQEHGIKFQSFWTIGANPRLMRSAPVLHVAQAAGVGAVSAYYALVMGLEGVTILDGTTSQVHMKEDLEGLERVGVWAEGDGEAAWTEALEEFKQLIGEP